MKCQMALQHLKTQHLYTCIMLIIIKERMYKSNYRKNDCTPTIPKDVRDKGMQAMNEWITLSCLSKTDLIDMVMANNEKEAKKRKKDDEDSDDEESDDEDNKRKKVTMNRTMMK